MACHTTAAWVWRGVNPSDRSVASSSRRALAPVSDKVHEHTGREDAHEDPEQPWHRIGLADVEIGEAGEVEVTGRLDVAQAETLELFAGPLDVGAGSDVDEHHVGNLVGLDAAEPVEGERHRGPR